MNLKDLTEFPILNETTIPNDHYAVYNEVRVSRTKTLNSKSAVDLSPVKSNWLVDNTNFMFYSPTYAAQIFLENSHFIV